MNRRLAGWRRLRSSPLMKVSYLLDRETGSWNADKVRCSFLPHEAEVILGISTSPRLLEDSLILAWTNNERFWVKSAYKVAKKWLKNRNIKADAGGTSDKSRMQTLWKLIWNLNCPNKIKQFMWHSCRNILLIKHRLKSRGISIEDGCDQCGLSESSGYILWGCKLASKVWSESRLKLPYIPNQMQEFIELVWEMIEKKPNID